MKQLNTIEKGRKMLAEVIKSEDVGDSRDSIIFSLSPTKVSRLKEIINSLGQKGIKLLAGNKQIKVLTDDFTVNKAIFSQKGRTSREVNARIKAIPDFENILRHSKYVGADTDIRNIENAAKKGVISMLHFEAQYGDYTLDILFRDKGTKQYLYEIKFIDNKKSSQQSMADKTASTAPKGDVENKNSITHDAKEVNSELKFSFAGKHAKTADVAKLSEAQRMENEGADSEAIRKATGWHKGYDGKWRFEIDDSKLRLFKSGDALFSQMHPKYVELQNLYNKLFAGDITAKEQKRLAELDEVWGRERSRLGERVKSGNATLENIVQHDALFEAYPELRKVRVEFADMDSGEKGSYSSTRNVITLSNSLSWEYTLKETLLHEIEHAIQHIEGFAVGSNPTAWEFKKKSDLDESKKAHDDTLSKILSFENGNHLDKWREYNRGEIELSELLAEESYTQEEKELFLKHIQNSQRYLALRNDSRSGEMLYEKTAGEIEARDVSARADLDAAQRKNTRPDIDRADVVFADSGESYSIEETTDGRPVVIVNDDITKYASDDKGLVKLVKDSIAKIPYVAISKQKIFFTTDTKREVTFSKYTKWLRNNDLKIYQDKMRLFNHPAEIILATTDYVNEGLNHPRNDDIIDFARGDLLVDILGEKYSAEVVIGFTKKGICELHDVVKLTPTKFKYKTRDALSTISYSDEHLQKRSSLVTNSISNPDENVKGDDNIIGFSVSSSGDGEGNGVYSDKTLYADGEVYDYDFLVSLPDMNVVDVADLSTLRNNGEIDRDIVVQVGKNNAGSDRKNDAIVKNRYTKHELTITNKSIYHGLNGEHKALMTNARIGAAIGDIVKNAVPINGLKNESKDAIGTYAMAALAKGEDGRNFVAIVTVEVKTGNVKEVFFEDVVHSLKGRIIKKESDLPGTKPLSSRIKSLLNENHSTISISDFLEIVNITHQSILSNDVLRHYGEERNSKGYYADRVLFSVSSDDGEGGRDSDEKLERINEWGIRNVLFDALDKGDTGDENLILLGAMPQYIKTKFGIDGGLYVFRNHIYENMVSEKQANLDGRNSGKGAHFHNLGEDTLVDAIIALEKPSIVIADKMKNGNPEISMILPVFGANEQPIHAAISFYKNEPINGSFSKRPHIAVTFYEHPYNDYTNDRGFIRDGLLSVIEKAHKENRILDVSEKIRADQPVIAENPVLGNIAKSTLNNNIAEFKKKVKEFKENNKISYSVSENGGNSNDSNADSSFFAEKKNSIRSIEHKLATALDLTEKESKAFLKKYLHPLTLKLMDGEAPDIDMLDNLIQAANEIKADSAENEVFSEVGKKTGISLREIALDMESRGESAEDIRELTGLYRDNVGGWQFDSKWLEKNSGDLASNREAAHAAAKSAFNITDAGITPETALSSVLQAKLMLINVIILSKTIDNYKSIML